MEEYRNQTGRIFDIQRFSIHDGPGIRTIVFLKGCMFRCKWCCNPEGQTYEKVYMHMQGKKDEWLGQDVTAEEVMDIVMKDYPYYRRSDHGGLTMSGGEALLQPDFAKALCKLAHENGITTCVETTGGVPLANIEKVLPDLDYVLMDIKHMNSEKHKEWIGTGNERVLENAKYIAEHANSLTIRIPTIPGFNDSEKEIREIAKFARSLPNVKGIHLLPYHRLGSEKYAGIGRTYELPELLPPSKEHMEFLLSVAKESGLPCQIGG